MEHRKPHEIANRLLEARLEMRVSANLALETALIERTSELPEDNFCHFARETLQFFATQPRNRYLNHEVAELERKVVAEAAQQLLETGEMPELEGHIDAYRVEAAAAFIEGYLITSSMLPAEPNEIEVA